MNDKICDSCEELRGFVRYRDEEIAKLNKHIKELSHENYKLSLRLDTCLYAMVIFQDLIRSFKVKQAEVKESIALAI